MPVVVHKYGGGHEQRMVFTEYRPPIPKRRKEVTSEVRKVAGAFLEQVFYENELKHKFHNLEIRDLLWKKFHQSGHKTYRQRLFTGKITVGMERRRYNEVKLHSRQQPIYLVSLTYNKEKQPISDPKKAYEYMTHHEAYTLCQLYKVADPRFIPADTLDLMRGKQNEGDLEWMEWTVPPVDYCKMLRDEHNIFYDCLELDKEGMGY